MRYFFLSLIIPFILCSQIHQKLEDVIQYAQDKTNKIGYIQIKMDRPIDQSTFIKVKFAIEQFRKEKIIFLYLHLNTPGGEVFAAQKLSKLLQEIDIHYGIPVVAFIDNWAVSAGAMLAYASRFIGITSSSIMGAAEPVISQGNEMQAASEKINSALRAEFSNLASFYGRDPFIAEAMVDKDMILVFRDGQFVKLESQDQIRTSDEVISNQGKLLTLDANKLMQYGVADFSVVVEKRAPISESEKRQGSWSFQKMPLAQDPFFGQIPNAEIITYRNWKVGFFSFLSHPIVASMLVIGMIVGFYIEINTPGFGLFGSIALGCLCLILLNSFSVQAIHWLELIIFGTGVVLLCIELFVIPGFGILGILGIVLTIAGLFAFMIPNLSEIQFSLDPEKLNLTALAAIRMIGFLAMAVLVSVVVMFFLSKYVFPRFSLFSYLISKDEQTGYIAGYPKERLPKVHSEGIAYSSMRPSGKILIGTEIFDASSKREFIEKGEKIIVSDIIGNQIIVRKK